MSNLFILPNLNLYRFLEFSFTNNTILEINKAQCNKLFMFDNESILHSSV